MNRTIALLIALLPAPANAGGWAEPVLPPARPADLCKNLVISERTGEVLYYTNRCPGGARAGKDDRSPERPSKDHVSVDGPGTSPGNPGGNHGPDPDKPEKPAKPERPAGQNPGNDKPVGNAPFDGERGEEPSGKEKKQ